MPRADLNLDNQGPSTIVSRSPPLGPPSESTSRPPPDGECTDPGPSRRSAVLFASLTLSPFAEDFHSCHVRNKRPKGIAKSSKYVAEVASLAVAPLVISENYLDVEHANVLPWSR